MLRLCRAADQMHYRGVTNWGLDVAAVLADTVAQTPQRRTERPSQPKTARSRTSRAPARGNTPGSTRRSGVKGHRPAPGGTLPPRFTALLGGHTTLP